MITEKTSIVRTRDVMQQGVEFIDGMTTTKEAIATMRCKKVSALLVKKRNLEDACGIVAIQDLIREVIIPGRLPNDVNVYEIMTKPVITIHADLDSRYVARLFYRNDIRRAPVEDQGELIGMVSLRSLILDNDLF